MEPNVMFSVIFFMTLLSLIAYFVVETSKQKPVKKYNVEYGGENKFMERFEMYKDKRGEWRFRLVAPNHKIIAVSEGYHNKADCIHAIKKVRQYSATAEIEDLEDI